MKLEISVSLLIGIVLSAILTIGLMESGLGLAATSNGLVTANVNVGNVIYISVAPTSNTFGNVYPTDSYATNVNFVDTDNGGNLAANIFVSGGSWGYSGNTFGVSNTLWNPTSLGTYAGSALTNTLANTAITIAQPNTIVSSQSNGIYFGVNIPAAVPPGLWTENVIFENENLTAPTTNSITDTVHLTANVQGACYITLTPNTIAFGSVYANANVPTNKQVTDNDIGGNAPANVLVAGTDWAFGSNTFGVSNTLWDSASQTSYAGNALTSSAAITGITIPAPNYPTATYASSNIFFGLGVPGGAVAGTYTQTITIENSC